MFLITCVIYRPAGIATFSFLIIVNDFALPLHYFVPPSLRSSGPLVSRGDVINHVDALLVLIRRVPSFSSRLYLAASPSTSLCVPQSHAYSFNLKVSLITCSHRLSLYSTLAGSFTLVPVLYLPCVHVRSCVCISVIKRAHTPG